MELISFLITVLFFLGESFAQCPKDYVSSVQIIGKCIKSNICDGYVSRINPTICSKQKIINAPGETKDIQCDIAYGKDAEFTLYICDICQRNEYYNSCNNCQYDEYYITQQPGKCIKRFEFGRLPYNTGLPYITGYLNDDYATIIPECKPNQIISENFILDENGDTISQPFCITCPKEKPFINLDKNTCMEQNNSLSELIFNIKNPDQKGFIKRSSCTLFSSDGQTCVAECQPNEVPQEIGQKYNICKVCFGSKPFVSLDKTTCLSECPGGTFYSRLINRCLNFNECNGFINPIRRICYKDEQCQPKQIGDIPPSFYNKNSKQKMCYECPENQIFTKDNKCQGCPQGQVLIVSAQACVLYEVFFNEEKKKLKEKELGQSIIGTFNIMYTVLYPPNYCPPGQKKSPGVSRFPNSEYCYPCQKDYQKRLQNQCCEQGQFFDKIEFKCIDKCDKIVGYDFSCVTECQQDEVLKQILYQYESNGKQYEKLINQCISCNDFRVNFEDIPQSSRNGNIEKLQKCVYMRLCDPRKDTNIDNQCFSFTKYCPSFEPYYREPAIYYDKVLQNCVKCPPDQPFFEQYENSFKCTRCMTKIRNYDNGMCVEKIEQIQNPGAGIFKNYRLEFWPARAIGITGCYNSFIPFSYQGMVGLKECNQTPQNPARCKNNQVFDHRTQTCLDEYYNCSLILSNDSQRCQLNPCKDDEIIKPFKIDKNDPQFGIKTNYGYLYQCYKDSCPVDKPYTLDNFCIASCDPGYVQQEKKCIPMSKCRNSISVNKKQCTKCGRGEIIQKIEDIQYCIACPSDAPFIYQNNCVSQCPQDYITIEYQYDCVPFYQCNYFLHEEAKQCVYKCPTNLFEIEGIGAFKFCLEVCPVGYYHDYDTKQCKDDSMCKQALFQQKCLQQCPKGYKTKRKYIEIYDCKECYQIKKYEQDGFCVDECQRNQIKSIKLSKCINVSDCIQGVISEDKNSCIESCPPGQAPLNSEVKPFYCELCPQDKPNTDYRGDVQICTKKCRILNVNRKDLSCLKDMKDCKDIILLQPDGTYTCQYSCPTGYIESIIYTNEGSHAYKQCKNCPENTPIAYNQSCIAKCPFPTILKISDTQQFYCACPKDKPYYDFEGEVKICSKKCRIFDPNTTDFSCLRDFQSCQKNLILQSDGTYTCEKFCPQFGYIKEKVCNEKGEQCYFLCKKCPENTLKYKDECLAECPSPSISSLEFSQCIHQCPVGLAYELDEEQCSLLKERNKIVAKLEQNNWVQTRKCSPSLMIVENQKIFFPNLISEQFSQSEINYLSQLPNSQLEQFPILHEILSQFVLSGNLDNPSIENILIKIQQFQIPEIFNLSQSRIEQLKNDTKKNSQNFITWEEVNKFTVSYQRLCSTINLCVKERQEECQPPNGLVSIKGQLICKTNLDGYIFDKVHSSNKVLFYLDDPNNCQGMISLDGKNCIKNCTKSGELPTMDTTYIKCTRCLYFQPVNNTTNLYECAQTCIDGYAQPPEKRICLPYINQESKTINNQPQPSKEESSETNRMNEIIDGENKYQTHNGIEEERSDGLSKIEIGIISIFTFSLIQFLVYIVYLILKRYKANKTQKVSLQTESNERISNYREDNLQNFKLPASSVTNLTEEIDLQQSKPTSQAQTLTQI